MSDAMSDMCDIGGRDFACRPAVVSWSRQLSILKAEKGTDVSNLIALIDLPCHSYLRIGEHKGHVYCLMPNAHVLVATNTDWSHKSLYLENILGVNTNLGTPNLGPLD